MVGVDFLSSSAAFGCPITGLSGGEIKASSDSDSLTSLAESKPESLSPFFFGFLTEIARKIIFYIHFTGGIWILPR